MIVLIANCLVRQQKLAEVLRPKRYVGFHVRIRKTVRCRIGLRIQRRIIADVVARPKTRAGDPVRISLAGHHIGKVRLTIRIQGRPIARSNERELTSELFRRQRADPKLSRNEALQKSMLALLDHKGFNDQNGKMIFSYAHPLFWAPYTIIGNPGN